VPSTFAPFSLSSTTPSGTTTLSTSAVGGLALPAAFAPLSPSAMTLSGPSALAAAAVNRSGVGALPIPLFRRRAAVTPTPTPTPPAPTFNPGPIRDVAATVSDAQLRVSWASSATPGSVYQVYLDRALVWSGTATSCVLPHPTGRVQIDVGVVSSANARVDQSRALPAVPGGGGRIALSWQGGAFLGADTAAFAVFLGAAPGAAVNLAGSPIATMTAYPQGLAMDGFGMGGFGSGGFGSAASTYAWTSPPLAPGVWNLAVCAVDSAGNLGPAQTVAQTVVGPPAPPARNAEGLRLTATPGRLASPGPDAGGFGQGGFGQGGYGVGGLDGAPFVTLNWLAPNGS
jgi:hypothetical protein